MMPIHTHAIAAKFHLNIAQTQAVLDLLAEGATIPFIARYRKDKTGNLDEQQIAQIQEEDKSLKEFASRLEFVIKTIEDQGKMTDELQQQLRNASTLSELEDLYLPYKPKRKTKAQTAREQGLEPLAQWLLAQNDGDVEQEASRYLNDWVLTPEDALQGARDIIAEMVNEDATLRAELRRLFESDAVFSSKVLSSKEEQAIKYKDYYDYTEPVCRVPAHRALAVLRGFSEGYLRISIEPPEAMAFTLMEDAYLKKGLHSETTHIRKALRDAWKRLLQPSLESEFRMWLKQKSDEEAIEVFAQNLRQLLLASPLGSKRLLAIDPGYRTGCKTVVLSADGSLLHHTVIYVHEPHRLNASAQTIRQLVHQYQTEAVAVGDGTAGRETEKFIQELELGIPVFMVNEAGASIYSASELAREEFPNEDITVRGAISIGRRLMDPLAELVKIDPKSIGVGQYQHDVNQIRLKEKLDQTVVSCVNRVGANLNTASKHLLRYVSGINESVAQNIVAYRAKAGRFYSREELKKVPRLGEKAFEQCAGFLRIPEGEHPLDATGVHPESYALVEQMAESLGVSICDLPGNEKLLNRIEPKAFAAYGTHTVADILAELKKPGLDPRQQASTFAFANVFSLADLQEGMVLPGLVSNITRFGAFVNIGVKQDGLVHISEIAWRYLTDPAEVLQLGQQVLVKVLEVDEARKRISLSIRQAQEPSAQSGRDRQRISRQKYEQRELNDIDTALLQLKNKFDRKK